MSDDDSSRMQLIRNCVSLCNLIYMLNQIGQWSIHYDEHHVWDEGRHSGPTYIVHIGKLIVPTHTDQIDEAIRAALYIYHRSRK